MVYRALFGKAGGGSPSRMGIVTDPPPVPH
jgi:hypothetical protein